MPKFLFPFLLLASSFLQAEGPHSLPQDLEGVEVSLAFPLRGASRFSNHYRVVSSGKTLILYDVSYPASFSRKDKSTLLVECIKRGYFYEVDLETMTISNEGYGDL